jgi:imidazole glycerol-phosphate synthase subunit HisH
MLDRQTLARSASVYEGIAVITIFDYGAGNLRSVQNTLDAIGAQYELVRDAAGLTRATSLILPGVGHFGQMMRAIDELEVRSTLIERIKAGVPFLGICLGLQALFASSEEAPEVRGLGLYDQRIERFTGAARVPHMGWNRVQRVRASRLLEGAGDAPYVYYANSYYAPVTDATAASTDYSAPFTAVIEQRNIHGVQFHPEKSGPVGLAIMRNFVAACS